MLKNKVSFASILALLILGCSSLFSSGIYIEPGASLTYVRKFDSQTPGKPLRIININSSPMVYNISVVADEYRLKGYIPMPDTNWVKPMKNDVKVEPYDTVDIPIMISIPESDENYNRAWVCELSVMQSAWKDPSIGGKAGTVLQLGARATWLIETPFKKALAAINSDKLSVAPAIQPIQYGDSTINKGEIFITIRNDDEIEHVYSLESYIPNFGDSIIGRVLDIFPLTTEETGWILDPNWICPKKKKLFGIFSKSPTIKLGSGEVGKYPITIDMPPSEELNQRQFEGIILIRPDGQREDSRFVRYIISPGLEYKE
ncbi:hypothetical protein KAH81_04870 [bacterium]|nr:hypothetical protein [bacterium]